MLILQLGIVAKKWDPGIQVLFRPKLGKLRQDYGMNIRKLCPKKTDPAGKFTFSNYAIGAISLGGSGKLS